MWRIRSIDVDGGRLGRVWNEWFFLDQEKANSFLEGKVKSANKKESDRGKTNYYLFAPEKVEDISGYVVWAYSKMLCLDEIKIYDPS